MNCTSFAIICCLSGFFSYSALLTSIWMGDKIPIFELGAFSENSPSTCEFFSSGEKEKADVILAFLKEATGRAEHNFVSLYKEKERKKAECRSQFIFCSSK